MAIFEFKTRVAYDDIDENMFLSLRGALGMMQEAAIIDSDRSGFAIGDIMQTHVVWILARWHVRLVGKVKWNEPVVVKTWPRTVDRVTSERDFEILNADGEQIAIGESVWVLTSADTGRIIRIKPEVAAAYDLTLRRVFEDEAKEETISTVKETYSCNITKRDIDTNHHVNNRVYLDFAIEALPEAIDHSAFTEVRVHYKRQLLLGQKIRCYYGEQEGKHCVLICGEDGSTVHGIVTYQ